MILALAALLAAASTSRRLEEKAALRALFAIAIMQSLTFEELRDKLTLAQIDFDAMLFDELTAELSNLEKIQRLLASEDTLRSGVRMAHAMGLEGLLGEASRVSQVPSEVSRVLASGVFLKDTTWFFCHCGSMELSADFLVDVNRRVAMPGHGVQIGSLVCRSCGNVSQVDKGLGGLPMGKLTISSPVSFEEARSIVSVLQAVLRGGLTESAEWACTASRPLVPTGQGVAELGPMTVRAVRRSDSLVATMILV